MAKNDPRTEETTRTKALIWWNSLPDFGNPTMKGKHGLCTKFYNDRMFQSLTGREVENIWRNTIS